MDENVKQHHFLIAGNVVFQAGEDESTGSIPLNGILIQNKQELPMASLGKCQQILQHHFMTNMTGAPVKILNVVILSITHLGHFTKAEFEQAPAGMTVQQASEEILKAMEKAADQPSNG